MNDQSKTKCKARGVSLPPEVNERVNKRIASLQPKVKGFSHYVQLLVDWDLNGRKEPQPFKSAELPEVGLAA